MSQELFFQANIYKDNVNNIGLTRIKKVTLNIVLVVLKEWD